MPSRSSSRSSNPSEDNIKFSWKDQLSPRLIGLRGFRRASESTAKMRDSENRQFTMMHFPDRPTRRITEAEIPSEEECKQYLIRMRKASFAEQLQRRKEEQEHHSPPPPEPPLRSTFGPFTAPFLPLTPAQEEESPFDTGAQDDNTATGDFLRVPDDDARISNITEEGFNLARENSPQPVIISEAKTVRLERVDNLSPGGSPDASPTSSPRITEVPREWSKRKQSVQMVAIQRTSDFQKRKQSVQTVLIRRPSRAVHDALNSHPVHPHLPSINVHIRQDSSSDLLCRVCHVGLAENSGTCSTCGEEYSVPTSPSQSHHDLPGANFSRPQYKQPQPQPIKKYHRPPPLIPQSLDSIASLHRPSASLTSDPEANQLSPPPSPRSPSSATHPTQKVLTIADAPPTPLSALPTPEVLKRFQQEIDSKARAEGGSMFGDPWNVRPTAEESKSFEDAWDRKESGTESDVYEDDWADYYFDEGNFDAGRRKQTKVTTPEVQGFMQRELSLDEYDGAFASPVNPGPGWI